MSFTYTTVEPSEIKQEKNIKILAYQIIKVAAAEVC